MGGLFECLVGSNYEANVVLSILVLARFGNAQPDFWDDERGLNRTKGISNRSLEILFSRNRIQ